MGRSALATRRPGEEDTPREGPWAVGRIILGTLLAETPPCPPTGPQLSDLSVDHSPVGPSRLHPLERLWLC